MRHEDADAGAIIFAELPPEALVEAADAIIRVGRGLAVRDTVEEVAVVGAFLPHLLHGLGARLKVAKVLFAESRFLVHLDRTAAEGRGRFIVGREGF